MDLGWLSEFVQVAIGGTVLAVVMAVICMIALLSLVAWTMWNERG